MEIGAIIGTEKIMGTGIEIRLEKKTNIGTGKRAGLEAGIVMIQGMGKGIRTGIGTETGMKMESGIGTE